MYAPIYQLCTLLLSMVFLCVLPAYLLGRRGIKQTLLTVEEGFSTRTCLITYTLLGWGSIILLLLFAFFASSLIFFLIAGWNEPSAMQYVHSGTSVCSTILFAWIHIHTRRSRQRLRQKYPLTHRLSSLLVRWRHLLLGLPLVLGPLLLVFLVFLLLVLGGFLEREQA